MTRTTRRMVGVGITLVATVGLAVAASGVTSAYFSDTNSGTVSGTIGYVKVSTGGGTGTPDGLDLKFENLMPGEPQTVKFDYKNIGTGPQDIWITFPNNAALHALNNLGKFGYLKLTDSSAGVLFESSNLNDGRTIPPNGDDSCGTQGPTGGLCWPLKPSYKIRTALPVGAEGTLSITFAYSSDLTLDSPPPLDGTGLYGGAQIPWNIYPVPKTFGDDLIGGSGTGLPYNVVATQVGQTP
jgi:hypothetical protein